MRQFPRIPPDDERCSRDDVPDSTGWHYNRCSRQGVVNEDGKLWCKQHSPSATRARQGASDARYKAESDARSAPYRKIERLEATNRDLLAALEPAFERCKTSGSFHPTMDWMKMADAAIAKARLCAGTK